MVRGGEGVMRLSLKEIEFVGGRILDLYRSRYRIDTYHQGWPVLSSLDVDNFAVNFLGLRVRYAKLSDSRDLCGITAYEDTVFLTECGPRSELLELKKGDVVLADYLKDSRYESRECRRRFTLAHECAHQIIYALGDAGNDYEKRSFRVTRVSSEKDPSEWRANTLGACLLLPRDQVEFAVWYFTGTKNRIMSGIGKLKDEDRDLVNDIAKVFGVSRTCCFLRLRSLGFIEEIKKPWEMADEIEEMKLYEKRRSTDEGDAS
ncbi:MAG: ImmA/IrrE family metallo-endopeptidase [Clostridia bacterium]|nr:ImmA/IrrE family metallo-endopeptidase [Clostridia bacterium]